MQFSFAATPSFESDMDVVKYHDWTWQESGSLDQKIVPWGIRRILLYVKGMSKVKVKLWLDVNRNELCSSYTVRCLLIRQTGAS